MKRAVLGTLLAACAACAAWLVSGQSPEAPPKFEAADVHASARTPNPSVRTGALRGRYEVKTATMVDLIKLAYGFDSEKILGGPTWLEMDRFDVIAKLPAGSTSDTQKEMLQALLADRFKLVVHKETKPVPAFALTVGKKPQLKEAAGTEPAGCKVNSDSAPQGEGGVVARFMGLNPDGTTTTLTLGPGMVLQYSCRNMTMAAFADGLHTMMGTGLGSKPIADETGLKGNWNFDLRYSMQMMMGPMAGAASDRISLFDALEKQLGLKLEEKPVATPVIVVDSVSRTPSANPPNLAEALPPISAPTEFEVASVKPSDPDSRAMRFQMQPGGRLLVQGVPARFLVSRAFNTNNSEMLVGGPGAANTDRYDIVAKSPVEVAQGDQEALAPMLLSLLVDRFKMKYHTEERPVSTYALVAAKPKMKKADPESRSSCKSGNAPAGAPQGSRVLTCQNVTMAQFADRLQNLAPGLSWPVPDATGIEGSWDFTLTYSMGSMMPMAFAARQVGGPDPGPGGAAVPAASEPVGGNTIFEAVEKQLGLKLEKQKRTEAVIVIDHFEKPTEN